MQQPHTASKARERLGCSEHTYWEIMTCEELSFARDPSLTSMLIIATICCQESHTSYLLVPIDTKA